MFDSNGYVTEAKCQLYVLDKQIPAIHE